MPNRVLRAAMQRWIRTCCDADSTDAVVDRLLEMGVRSPALTLNTVEELDQVPNGSAVVVGDLSKGGSVGTKVEHAILFAGEDAPYPFHMEGLAPPLPCTVVWVPLEGRLHFARIFARQTAELLGLDKAALLAEFAEEAS